MRGWQAACALPQQSVFPTCTLTSGRHLLLLPQEFVKMMMAK